MSIEITNKCICGANLELFQCNLGPIEHEGKWCIVCSDRFNKTKHVHLESIVWYETKEEILSELKQAESESRTDRLLDELADNMAKADEAMKPDKPLEQSEINPAILDQIVRQQEEIDRQAAEIKRLKERNRILENIGEEAVKKLSSIKHKESFEQALKETT